MILNYEELSSANFATLVRKEFCNTSKKVFIQTFGCQQNEADSEKILGLCAQMGFERCDDPLKSDMIIFNTCAIREHAEVKALSMLGRYKALKSDNPDLIIGLCGCMASEKHIVDLLKNKFHYVTFTLEPNMLHKIPEIVYNYYNKRKRSFVFGLDEGDLVEGMPTVRRSHHRAWVSIMYGCNNFCSYCIVPYTRGRERSRLSCDVITECKELVKSGIKEITLLGQNVNSYNSDVDFPTLIEKIAEIEGEFIIRFMTSHPKDVSDKLIEVMTAHTPKIAPFFHLPLQSGSNRILGLMNRTYTREHFLDVVRKLKDTVPGIALSTDVIVGFPSESEEDFQSTLDVLRTVEFDMVYAFEYSARESTPAALSHDQISKEIKGERLSRLLKVQDEISLKKNEEYVGCVKRVLVDSMSKRAELCTVNARCDSNKLVHFTADESYLGKFVNVKITKACVYDLIGEIIKQKRI